MRWPRAPSWPNHGNFVAGHCPKPGLSRAYGSSWHASNRLGSAESAVRREEAAVAEELLGLVERLKRAVRRQAALVRPPLLELRERRHASSTIVTGPSLTSSTSIFAPKTPVSTGTPRLRSSAQKRS